MQFSLDRFRLLTSLDAADAAALSSACRDVVEIEADADLVEEGDAPQNLHVLLEGWACRYVLLPDGRRQIPALLLPGDVVDLDALQAERRNYSVATLTKSRVALLSLAAVRSAIEQHPQVGRAFLTLALQENAMLTRRTVSLGRQSAREQVAHVLCELVTRMAGDGGAAMDGKYALPLTQGELGDVLGLSTVHVNRVLQGLRADDLIRIGSKRLEIMDWTRLAAAGEFQPRYLQADGNGSPRPRLQDGKMRSGGASVHAFQGHA